MIYIIYLCQKLWRFWFHNPSLTVSCVYSFKPLKILCFGIMIIWMLSIHLNRFHKVGKLYMPSGILIAFLILAFSGKCYGHTEQIESWRRRRCVNGMYLSIFYIAFSFVILYLIYLVIEFLQAAIISLGLIGAGTNNARIAGMLRNLSSYYYKEAAHLFCVSIDP